MAALLRLFLLALLAATIVWISAALYLRSLRAERLEEEWQGKRDQRIAAISREDYVRAGLREFDRSLRRWSLIAVWAFAFGGIGALIYYVNYH